MPILYQPSHPALRPVPTGDGSVNKSKRCHPILQLQAIPSLGVSGDETKKEGASFFTP